MTSTLASMRVPVGSRPRRHMHRRQAGIVAAAAGAALLGAAGIGAGAEFAVLAAVSFAALLAAGAAVGSKRLRWILLLALLLVPEAPSGATLGLRLPWSTSLSWANFVLPGLAVPLLAGHWLRLGGGLAPPWPRLGFGMAVLLGWGLLTLLPPLAAGELAAADRLTLAAHVAKLGLVLAMGCFLAAAPLEQRGGLMAALAAGLALNFAVGLAQAAGWFPVFSPLGRLQVGAAATGARASGLFYDANFFGVVAAGALMAAVVAGFPEGAGWERRAAAWGGSALAAAALIASGSRAGYLALAAGTCVLLVDGQRRAAGRVLLLVALLMAMFPARSWQRIRATAVALHAALPADRLADAAAPGLDPVAQRLQSMGQAARQIGLHPWLGLGFGRSLYLGVAARTAEGRLPPVPARFTGAQNMFLTVWAETGPVGLMLLMLTLGATVRGLWPRLRAGTAPAVASAILAGFCGAIAASFTIEIFFNARLLALAVMVTHAYRRLPGD